MVNPVSTSVQSRYIPDHSWEMPSPIQSRLRHTIPLVMMKITTMMTTLKKNMAHLKSPVQHRSNTFSFFPSTWLIERSQVPGSASAATDMPPEFRPDVDRIFFEFLNKLCSNCESDRLVEKLPNLDLWQWMQLVRKGSRSTKR
jgi:hypothetical protein